MSILKSVLSKFLSKDRRRAERQPAPSLAAFYWTNASPAEHLIRDISPTGLYLLTEERWYPGTLLMMTLQRRDQDSDGTVRSIAVQSKAVRWGADGVGLEFVLPDSHGRTADKSLPDKGADRKTLEKFLAGFRPENGLATVSYADLQREEPS